MTQEEWLTGHDPTPMLELVGAREDGRKLRLLGCAWCRAACWGEDDRHAYHEALGLIERHADGLASLDDVTHAIEPLAGIEDHITCAISSTASLCDRGVGARSRAMTKYRIEAIQQVGEDAAINAGLLSVYHLPPESEAYRDTYTKSVAEAVTWQVATIRDVFGNPFSPVAFDPSWRTEAVVALARGMYEARDFAAMPVLADALDDAGCDQPDVLAHCRDAGPHVRGCWVVDLVLGKA